MLKKVLDKLNGYAYRQEYLCLAEGPFDNPLHAYLMENDVVAKDITQQHLFVGYCPLIFAFPWPSEKEKIEIRFSPGPAAKLTKSKALASLELKKINQLGSISFYEGISAHHRFVSPLHQWINGINNRLYQQKVGNVYLDNKLYPQVQTAYALPRRISLISLELNGGFNVFPTDLHGQINPAQFIISLRHGGMACQQVQEAGKIVVSAVRPSLYKEVYKLGKNHMQPVKPKESFLFSNQHSKLLGLPLPLQTIGYHELQLKTAFNHGIHRILLFDIKNQNNEPGGMPLTHIHNSYATWRLKHGLSGNYLLR